MQGFLEQGTYVPRAFAGANGLPQGLGSIDEGTYENSFTYTEYAPFGNEIWTEVPANVMLRVLSKFLYLLPSLDKSVELCKKR